MDIALNGSKHDSVKAKVDAPRDDKKPADPGLLALVTYLASLEIAASAQHREKRERRPWEAPS
ncbi:hypothetical protein BWI17_13585 [Betaproteobacteria bacterium GR16-43]|nr:hypothetical protein BWI17_13585 [Betaproteobacteria bacterium GR16-43]